MSETDIIISGIDIEKEGTFDFRELLKLLKSLSNKHGYDFYEKEYNDKHGIKNKIKWDTEKKIDDYTKFHIDITIKTSDLKKISLNKKTVYKGKINITFEAYFEHDYDAKFKNVYVKLLRVAYERFFKGVKFKKFEKEITDETYDMYNKTKDFLRLDKTR